MIEAFAIIGLAANIAQFVEYGIRLISEGWETYSSTRGATEGNLELKTVVQDLRDLSGNVAAAAHRAGPRGEHSSADEKAVQDLAGSSKEIVNTLPTITQDLEIQDDAHHRKLTSLRLAFTSAKRRKEIDDLEKRLQRVQEQLGRRMLTALRRAQLRQQ